MSELLRLFRLYRPYRGWMALGMALSFLTLIANVGLMALSGWFIAAMATAGISGAAMNYFTPAAGIRGLAIVRTVGRYLERLVTHEATLRLLAGLRVWFYEHLEPLAPARLQQFRSGDLLSRIRADIDSLDHLYLRILLPLTVAAAGVLAISLFLWLQAPRLALVNLGFLLLAGVVLPLWIERRAHPGSQRLIETRSALRASVVDGVQGMAELTVYGAFERQAQTLDGLSRRLVEDQDRLSGLSGISQGALGLCAGLSLWVLLLLSVPLVREGHLEPPDLAMLALFTLASFEAVMPLPGAFQVLGETLAAARRLLAVVDAPAQVHDPAGVSPTPRDYSIELQGVGFRYQDDAPRALDGVDLRIPAGGKLAIMGATGAGKSSLANLLLRFWEPQEGRILLGGEDLRSFRGEDVRRLIGVVSQRTHLFNARIRDNLLLANPSASQGALEQACRVAQIHAFIESQPEGYDTWVGEAGLKLSGGQARRIAIARALLKDAPILLLDEPTEGLDAPTQHALMQALFRLMEGRSVLLITHRAGGLEAMDEILVMDEGRILERGAPASLLSAGARYGDLTGFLTPEAP
jgi:ATP-binding cassette subfamily C protein CydC